MLRSGVRRRSRDRLVSEFPRPLRLYLRLFLWFAVVVLVIYSEGQTRAGTGMTGGAGID